MIEAHLRCFFFSFLMCIMFWERVMSFCIIIPALSQAHINLNLYGIQLLCLYRVRAPDPRGHVIAPEFDYPQ